MTALQIFLLAGAAAMGSALNAVAGGGSFFTFPALIFTGVPILNANATSTVALWPGTVSSAYAYRNKLHIEKRLLLLLIMISMIGSIAGTSLLLITPPDVLRSLLPYLMFSATLLLVFKKKIANNRWMNASSSNTSMVMILQFIISVYGGYFGGGMGILMLATFSLMGFVDLVQMNALKAYLGTIINGSAVVIFVVMNKIFWSEALVMLTAGIFGGYFGAWLGTRVSQKYLHYFIIAVGTFFSIYFFVSNYQMGK
jgi:uncharacterized membrane protein YfcA